MTIIDIILLCLAGLIIHFLGFRYGVRVGMEQAARRTLSTWTGIANRETKQKPWL